MIVLNGERLFVQQVDRAALSPNLGLLVCPVEDRENTWDPRNRWERRTDYEVEPS